MRVGIGSLGTAALVLSMAGCGQVNPPSGTSAASLANPSTYAIQQMDRNRMDRNRGRVRPPVRRGRVERPTWWGTHDWRGRQLRPAWWGTVPYVANSYILVGGYYYPYYAYGGFYYPDYSTPFILVNGVYHPYYAANLPIETRDEAIPIGNAPTFNVTQRQVDLGEGLGEGRQGGEERLGEGRQGGEERLGEGRQGGEERLGEGRQGGEERMQGRAGLEGRQGVENRQGLESQPGGQNRP